MNFYDEKAFESGTNIPTWIMSKLCHIMFQPTNPGLSFSDAKRLDPPVYRSTMTKMGWVRLGPVGTKYIFVYWTGRDH